MSVYWNWCDHFSYRWLFHPWAFNKDCVGGSRDNQLELHFSNHLFKLLCCSLHGKRVCSPGETHTSKSLFIIADIQSATFFTHHLPSPFDYINSIHSGFYYIPLFFFFLLKVFLERERKREREDKSIWLKYTEYLVHNVSVSYNNSFYH